jgi:hypothetical protein
MRRPPTLVVAITAALLAGAATSAVAAERATFLGDGVWARKGDCARLARLAAGGPRNIRTTPEQLTAGGYSSWEGSCEFLSIRERTPGKAWIAELSCIEGPEEGKETNLFEKVDARTFKVTVNGEAGLYFRCDLPKSAKK